MILTQLFTNFLNIGIFSFGGGYATLPFLQEISEKRKGIKEALDT